MQIDANILRSVMAWWDDSGVDVPPVKPAPKVRAPLRQSREQGRPLKTQTSAASPKARLAAPANEAIEKAKLNSVQIAAAAPTLAALKTAIMSFDAGDLSVNATQAVFARGNPEAKLMVIGEAPGREEDAAGTPFIGASGALLDKMLAAIGLDADSAYITTVCNWRPLSARGPSPDEIALCLPFITRHIELAAPDVIILAGGVPLEALAGIKGMIKTRGQWQSVKIGEREIDALPIYHPDMLLKNADLKRDAWHDLLAVAQKLED